MTAPEKPVKRSPGRPAKPKVTPPEAQSEIDSLKAELAELKALLTVQAELNKGTATPTHQLEAMLTPDFSQPGTKVLIHFVEDGWTWGGYVWYRGQELEFTVGTPEWDKTIRNGESWVALAYDERAQRRKWGHVKFKPGPWDGLEYEDEFSAKQEAKRARRLPPPPRPD